MTEKLFKLDISKDDAEFTRQIFIDLFYEARGAGARSRYTHMIDLYGNLLFPGEKDYWRKTMNTAWKKRRNK